MVKKASNKIFLFPLTLAVIFFASMIIIFSPVGKKNIINVTQAPIEWKTYSDKKYNFEFQYPSNLIINTESNKIIISDPLEKYSKAIIDLEQFNNISYPASKWFKGKSPSLVCIDQNCPVEYEVSNVNLSNNLESTLIEYNFGFSFEKNYLIYSPKTGYLSFHYGSNGDLVNQESKIIDTYNKILSTFKFIADTSTWKTYKSEEYGFEFKYPNNWGLIIFPEATKNENGDILTLQSPETIREFEEKKLPIASPDDFVVSHYLNINNEYLLGGSWTGQREYQNLSDFLNDPTVPFVQKVGLTTIGDKQAYKVSTGGHYAVHGIMIETTSGIYQISFPTAWDESKLTDIQKRILSTFKFTN